MLNIGKLNEDQLNRVNDLISKFNSYENKIDNDLEWLGKQLILTANKNKNIKIEIMEDRLTELILSLKEEIRSDFIEYIKNNTDIESFDNYYEQGAADRMYEYADSIAPIYNYEINDLYYLYSSEFEEAYNDAGLYDKQPDNYKQVCIAIYLENKGHEFLHKLEEITDNFLKSYQYENTEDKINKLIKLIKEIEV
jgi:hypothetical protein